FRELGHILLREPRWPMILYELSRVALDAVNDDVPPVQFWPTRANVVQEIDGIVEIMRLARQRRKVPDKVLTISALAGNTESCKLPSSSRVIVWNEKGVDWFVARIN